MPNDYVIINKDKVEIGIQNPKVTAEDDSTKRLLKCNVKEARRLMFALQECFKEYDNPQVIRKSF